MIIATTCGNMKKKNGPRRTYVEPGTGGRAGPKWISMENGRYEKRMIESERDEKKESKRDSSKETKQNVR